MIQELSEGYDALMEHEKRMIPVAHLTGFFTKDGERRFIIDQNHQLNLTTMAWYKSDNLCMYQILAYPVYYIETVRNLGIFYLSFLKVLVEPKFEDEIKMDIE